MARLQLGLREGWITVLLLAGTLLSVVWAIQRADWADSLDILTPIALAGLALGLALAKWRRLPFFVAHAIALLAGGWLVVNQLDPLLPLARDKHGWWAAFRFLRERGYTWITTAGTDKYADDFYLFLLGLATIVFFMSYLGAWMIFRDRWVWPALLLPTVVLLLNMGYAPANLSSYLVLFLLLALLLVARFHVAEREEEWRRGGVEYPESLAWRTLGIGLVVATLTVGFAWLSPVTARGAVLEAAWARVNSPWQRVEGRFNELFGSLRGPGARGIGNFASFGDRFRLGGPLKLSQNPILVLQGDYPYYLKVRTFDSFDGHQWDTKVADTFNPNNEGRAYVPQIDLKGGQDLALVPPAATSRHDLLIHMLAPRGNALFTAEQFVKTSQDSYVQLSWTQYHDKTFDLQTAKREDLPPDLAHLYDLLKDAKGLRDTDDRGNPLPFTFGRPPGTPGAGATPGRFGGTPGTPGTPRVFPTPTPSAQEREIAAEQAALSNRLIQARPVVKGGQAVGLIVNGQIANYGDVEVVLPRDALQRGTQYRTTTLVSNATAPQLRDANGPYPDWVTQRYLQLPASTTQRTRDLAAGLRNNQDPYDAAITIQNWLRENVKYNEQINFPPADRDVVDYLLFDSRQGYCEYYSTAMVVMLRSLGIPAREAVGLFSGEYNNELGGYVYRESNAHAWVEAYFPGYGWVPFEPTTPRAPFDREVAASGSGDPENANGPATAGGVGEGLGDDSLLPDDPRFLGGGGLINTRRENPVLKAVRIAIPLLALAALILTFLWLRGLRGLSPTGQFYARMTRSGGLAGVRPPPGTTPYEYAREVSRAVPGTRRSLDQIAGLYVREQYGGETPTVQEVRLVRRAWLTFRAALLRSIVSFRRRGAGGEEAGD